MMLPECSALILLIVTACGFGASAKVISGSWEYVHGPSNLYVSHFYDLHGYVPPNAITFRFNPDSAADVVAFRGDMARDRGIFPSLCFEIDPKTDLPLTADAGRDRVGGWESVKGVVMDGPVANARTNLLTLRFGRLRNGTKPLIVLKDAPMVVRCGPLVRRVAASSNADSDDQPAELHRRAYSGGGGLPEGYASYLISGDVLSDMFVNFTILATTPNIQLMSLSAGTAMAAVRSLARPKNAPPLFDVDETELRRHGLGFRLSIGYDMWAGWGEPVGEDLQNEIKRRIAESITCSPLPCHRRMRSRRSTFSSADDLRRHVSNTVASDDVEADAAAMGAYLRSIGLTAEESARDAVFDGRIITPGDITLTPSEAVIHVSPDELLVRGFDVLPSQEPPTKNLDHNGREVAVPETLYALRITLPAGITARAEEAAELLSHPSVHLGMTYTMAAFKFAPTRLRMMRYSSAHNGFEVSSDGVVRIAEDCVTRRNSSVACKQPIVATIDYSKPSHHVIEYTRALEVFESYLLEEEEEEEENATWQDAPNDEINAPQNDNTFRLCRRRSFGWPAIQNTFVSMRGYVNRDVDDTITVQQLPQPNFDIDVPVRLHIDFHAAMFLAQQPPVTGPVPSIIELVPSPGHLEVTVEHAQDRLKGEATELVLGKVELRIHGDVWLESDFLGLDRTERVVISFLREVLGVYLNRDAAGVNEDAFVPLSLDEEQPSTKQRQVDVAVGSIDFERREPCGGFNVISLQHVTVSVARHDPASSSSLQSRLERVLQDHLGAVAGAASTSASRRESVDLGIAAPGRSIAGPATASGLPVQMAPQQDTPPLALARWTAASSVHRHPSELDEL